MFNKNKFSEIKTERLLLRKPVIDDAEMISYLRSDNEVNKYVKRSSATSKGQALEFIKVKNDEINTGKIFYYVITKKNNSKMIGSICLWNFSTDLKTAEIGYDLSPKFKGKGIISEALHSVLEFGFEKLNLDLIEAYTQSNNIASIKMLERNNFKLVVGKTDEDNLLNLVYEFRRSFI